MRIRVLFFSQLVTLLCCPTTTTWTTFLFLPAHYTLLTGDGSISLMVTHATTNWKMLVESKFKFTEVEFQWQTTMLNLYFMPEHIIATSGSLEMPLSTQSHLTTCYASGHYAGRVILVEGIVEMHHMGMEARDNNYESNWTYCYKTSISIPWPWLGWWQYFTV